jgi:hypothetical protein
MSSQSEPSYHIDTDEEEEESDENPILPIYYALE